MKPEQEEIFKRINSLCQEIEKEMKTTVDVTDPEQLKYQLEQMRPYLANIPLMIAQCVGLYDSAKGDVINDICLDERILNLKDNLQRQWCAGRLAKFGALMARVESLEKNLRSSIDAIVSQLSFEKYAIQNNYATQK